MKKVILPKLTAWIILAILVFLDSIFNVIRGAEGNPLWKPILNYIGIQYTPLLVPVVLVLFYFVVKAGGWLVKKVDKTPHAEGLVLTALVLVYAVFDIWVISVDFLGFTLIKSHYHFLPIIALVVLIYSLWAEHYLKKK